MRRVSMDYVVTMLRQEVEQEKAEAKAKAETDQSKHPFTKAELAEALAELDEGAFEWVAYCTTCKAAVEADNDHRIVLAKTLDHINRHPEHQVIVGHEILGRSYGVCVGS